VDRGSARPSALDVRDDDAVEGDRAAEVERAIDWIHDPQTFGLADRGFRALLRQHGDRGVMQRETFDDRLLRGVIGRGREVRTALLACDDLYVRLDDRVTAGDRGLRGDASEGRVSCRIRRAGAAAGHAGQSSRTRWRRSLRSNGLVRTDVRFRLRNSLSNIGVFALTKSTGMSRMLESSRTRSYTSIPLRPGIMMSRM